MGRLNLQHYIWKDGLGYLTYPSIPLTNTNYRIADLVTGTGYDHIFNYDVVYLSEFQYLVSCA